MCFIADLTSREQAVVAYRCGARELSMQETADAMFITLSTLKNHVTSIIRKVDARSFFGVCRMYGEQNAWQRLTAMRAETV